MGAKGPKTLIGLTARLDNNPSTSTSTSPRRNEIIYTYIQLTIWTVAKIRFVSKVLKRHIKKLYILLGR